MKTQKDNNKLVKQSYDLYKKWSDKVDETIMIRDFFKSKYVGVINQVNQWTYVNVAIEIYLSHKSYTNKKVLKEALKDYLGDFKWDFKRIVDYDYAYQISFKICKNEYYIQIPILDNITVDNVDDAEQGMVTVFKKDSKHSSIRAYGSYEIEDVKNFLSELLSEGKANNEEGN